MPREATNWVIKMVDSGALDAREILLSCLIYMSDDEVSDMCHANELGYPENDNYSSDDDDDDDD